METRNLFKSYKVVATLKNGMHKVFMASRYEVLKLNHSFSTGDPWLEYVNAKCIDARTGETFLALAV